MIRPMLTKRNGNFYSPALGRYLRGREVDNVLETFKPDVWDAKAEKFLSLRDLQLWRSVRRAIKRKRPDTHRFSLNGQGRLYDCQRHSYTNKSRILNLLRRGKKVYIYKTTDGSDITERYRKQLRQM